jgi:AraC family transcriptional regulator of adaptative response/methylated-DNA-[protein]-cysteine methyltransferase
MENLDEIRWRAVQSRDHSVAGVFVYAVTTTGIFCRPGCGSRTPRRDNVEFFSSALDADAAGYRACRRCRPDEQRVEDASLVAVISLCRLLESDDAVDVGARAAQWGYSERHLRRRFSEVVGVPVTSYARAQRAQRARVALSRATGVTEAIYESGFGSSRAFYEHGATRLGMAPAIYRGGAPGERIGFTSIVTPLGIVVVASTARGVCALRIGADEASLTSDLVAEFPRALLERDDEGLADVVAVIARVIRGEDETSTLPLDLRGTAFQVRVWEALRGVERGSTLTYAQLAERLGSPRAARAVGSACGANPVALLVPCHRIVRRDGTLGGYRWGLALKEALLAAEGATPGS